MDGDQYKTPQKLFSKQSPSLKFLGSCTPQNKLKCLETTPSSVSRKTAGAFHLFPFVNTPPARLPKVINPFEQALTDRLHLPLICSPSLFQSRNSTNHSSGHFEWTIDEVSSLKPANVEPHEAQFQSVLDPDFEAKAQAAISSYFKEQQIVPSPVDCSLHKQKIQLPEVTGETPIAKSGRRLRDGIAQTILTFPPHLPEEVEAILKEFCTYHEPQQQSPTIDCDTDTTIDYEARDASLRRKLFGASALDHSELSCEVEVKMLMKYDVSPPPRSPDLNAENFQINSPSKNSFGSLSPISKLDSPEPNCNIDITDNPSSKSPQFSSTNYQISSGPCKYLKASEKSGFERTSNNSPIQPLYRSTPDGSFNTEPMSPNNMSVDMSSSVRSNRIQFNSLKKSHSNNMKSRSFSELDMFETSYNFEDDDMQVSQMSGKSTSSSNGSQHSDTPRRKRKSASRRNLSQSFSSHHIDTDDQGVVDDTKLPPLQTKKTDETEGTGKAVEQSVFHRTDSGFNEMTQTHDDAKFNELRFKEVIVETIETEALNYSLKDVSMISCSTPSKFPEF